MTNPTMSAEERAKLLANAAYMYFGSDDEEFLENFAKDAAEQIRQAEQAARADLQERIDSGGCTKASPGRGDCEHFMGLPGRSIPGQHDGPDDTVDAYGKPNGWCWSCWRSYQLGTVRADERRKTLEDGEGRYQSAVRGRQDFRSAYRRERERRKSLESLLPRIDEAINPPDKSGISLHEWSQRLKAITSEIRALAKQPEKVG